MSDRYFSKEAVRFLQKFQFLNEAHLDLIYPNRAQGQGSSTSSYANTSHSCAHAEGNISIPTAAVAAAEDEQAASRLPLDSLSIGDVLFTMSSWYMLFHWVKKGLVEKAQELRSRGLPLQPEGAEEGPSAHMPLLSTADYAAYQLERSDSRDGLLPAAPTPDEVLACDIACVRRSHRTVVQLEEYFTRHFTRDVLAVWLQDVLLLYVDCATLSTQDIQHDLRSLLCETRQEEAGGDMEEGDGEESSRYGVSTSGGGELDDDDDEGDEDNDEEEGEDLLQTRLRAPSSDVGVLLYFLLKQLFSVELMRLRAKAETGVGTEPRARALPYLYSLCAPYDAAAAATTLTPYALVAQSPQALLKMLRLVRLCYKGSRQVDTEGLVLNWPTMPPPLTASPTTLPVASSNRGRLTDPFRRTAEFARRRMPSLTASATASYKKKRAEQACSVAQLGRRPPFYRLPLDLQQHVLEYLPPRHVRLVSQVCRAWQYLVATGSPTLRHYAASSSAVSRAYVHFFERIWGVGALWVISCTTIHRLEAIMDSAQVRRLELSWLQAQTDPVARRRMDNYAAARTELLEAPSRSRAPSALTFAAPQRAQLSVCVFVGYLLEFREENRGTCAALEHVLQALRHEVKWRAFAGRDRRSAHQADLCVTEALDQSCLLWSLLRSDRGATPSVVEAIWHKWPHVCETWEAYRGTATTT